MLIGLGWLELARGNMAVGTRDLEEAANTNSNVLSELTVAETYSRVGEAARAVTHLKRAFDLNRSCVDTVATSIQFRSLRQTGEGKALLGGYGIR